MKKNEAIIEKGMLVTLQGVKTKYNKNNNTSFEGSNLIIEDLELNGKKVSRVKGEMNKEGYPLTVRGKLINDIKNNLEAELKFVGTWEIIEDGAEDVEEHGLYLDGKNIGVAEVQTTNRNNKEEATFEKNWECIQVLLRVKEIYR